MTESDFQFTNPSMVSMFFSENEKFEENGDQEIDIETKIQIQNVKMADHCAKVGVTIQIGDENDHSPFLLETRLSAQFQWGESIGEDRVELFLNQNAPALLVSYARPIISMLTNASRYPAYNMPFINFADTKPAEE